MGKNALILLFIIQNTDLRYPGGKKLLEKRGKTKWGKEGGSGGGGVLVVRNRSYHIILRFSMRITNILLDIFIFLVMVTSMSCKQFLK